MHLDWSGITLLVCISLLTFWYAIIFGYLYQNIGNTDDHPIMIQMLPLILAVGLVGCFLIALTVAALCFVYFSVDNAAILNIGISTLAIGTSVSALSISAIAH